MAAMALPSFASTQAQASRLGKRYGPAGAGILWILRSVSGEGQEGEEPSSQRGCDAASGTWLPLRRPGLGLDSAVL